MIEGRTTFKLTLPQRREERGERQRRQNHYGKIIEVKGVLRRLKKSARLAEAFKDKIVVRIPNSPQSGLRLSDGRFGPPWAFGFRISFGIRHSSFVVIYRRFCQPSLQNLLPCLTPAAIVTYVTLERLGTNTCRKGFHSSDFT